MVYTSRDIRDRVATGDDCFQVVVIEDGRVKLVPAPDEVVEMGTDINKALLQLIEDRVVWLMNSAFSEITSNPFNISFGSLNGVTVTGVWNTELQRIEC